MFTSPCSLRSPTCAALIALAAAAGISRFEPAPVKPAAPAPAARAEASTPSLASILFVSAWWRDLTPSWGHGAPVCSELAEKAAAHRAPRGEGAATPALPLLAPPAEWPPAPAADEGPITFFAPHATALSPRHHSYPYAVGPPRRGISEKLRADGMHVPGDSPARRSHAQLPRVARSSPSSTSSHSSQGAQLARTTDARPLPAASPLSPSSALRGEPGRLLHPLRPGLRLRAPAWPRPALSSP